MTKQISRVWAFASDSSDAEYETLQYSDGSTSCNCRGWTRRTAPDGSRSCKHTRLVDMGRADDVCRSSHDYHAPGRPANLIQVPLFQTPRLGERKIA